MMQRFTFNRKYIPTGEVSTGTVDAFDLCEVFKLLNGYNAQMPGIWQYWA